MAVSTGVAAAFVYWTPFPQQWALVIIVASGLVGAGAAAALVWGARRRKRPGPEISAADSVQWILQASCWGRDLQRDGLEGIAAAAEFERAAREGQISVRGRQRHFTNFETLSVDYWQTAGLDRMAALHGDPPNSRTEQRGALAGYIAYEDLRTSERQVRRCWPAPILDRLMPYRLRLERRNA
jgi:hypothetical protein